MLLTSTKGAHPVGAGDNPNRSDSASGALWPRRLALTWGAAILVFLAVYSTGFVGGIRALIVIEGAWTVAAVLATASCLRAAHVLSGSERLAWFLFAAANATWALGHFICGVYHLQTGHPQSFPTPGDVGHFAFGPLMMIALLLLRSTQRERRLTWLRVANLGLILCGLAVVLISMLARPFFKAELSLGSSLVVVIESVPLTIAFILSLYVLWSYRWGDRFEPVALITTSLALHMISTLFYVRSLPGAETGALSVFAVGWLLAPCVQQLAAESQIAIVRLGAGAQAQAVLARRQGWVEAFVPSVLLLCIALTGIAFEDEITRPVVRFGSMALALFALTLAVREGFLYWRGQHLRLQLQRASTELESSREQLQEIDNHRAELERDIDMTARAGGVGLWDWDLRSNLVRYSREWHRQLGYAEGELADTYDEWFSRVHPDDRERVANAIKAYLAKPHGEYVNEHRLRHRDGSYRWILVQGSLLIGDDGKPLRMLGSHIDITESKQIELSLRRSEQRYRELVDTLESRVTARTHELTDAYRESQNIAYAVAHDLKAPLRAIDGFSHLLEQSAMQRLSASEQTYIKRVRHGAIHMASLIDGLLAYSRLEHRELRPCPIDCRELVDDVLRSMRPACQAAGAEISVALTTCHVHADAEALSTAIQNLVDNALKFASPSRAPRIEIGGREEGDALVLWVRDNGIGFDPQYHDKIFEIFNRLHSTGYEGTGIGLALVRKAIRRMNGRVWAESAVDRGATFYIALPKKGADAQSLQRAAV